MTIVLNFLVKAIIHGMVMILFLGAAHFQFCSKTYI
jgi:hypothetical protein